MLPHRHRHFKKIIGAGIATICLAIMIAFIKWTLFIFMFLVLIGIVVTIWLFIYSMITREPILDNVIGWCCDLIPSDD
jgi:hypothetical protein